MLTCPHCGTLPQPKPVPGAVHFPRRLECPVHGYIIERISPRKDGAIYSALSTDAVVRTDDNVQNRPKVKATVMVNSSRPYSGQFDKFGQPLSEEYAWQS